MIEKLLQLDQSVFYVFNGLLGKSAIFDMMIKAVGTYTVYFAPIGLLSAWFIYKSDKDRINMIKATLTSVFLWQVPTRLIACLWYRPRPFTALANTKELVFHIPSYSFPSDHAVFLIAIATYFYLLGYKKIGIWIGIASITVGICRIISGLHYPGDILAGLLLGLIGAVLLLKLDKYIKLYLAEPMLKIAKIIKLA